MQQFLQRDFWSKLITQAAGTGQGRDEHGGGSRGTNKFSVEELHILWGVLERNPTVTEQNRSLVVETIRRAAEFLLWGDQNEPRVFEFFMENNVLAYLHR